MKTSMFIRVCAFLGIGAGVVFAANGANEWSYADGKITKGGWSIAVTYTEGSGAITLGAIESAAEDGILDMRDMTVGGAAIEALTLPSGSAWKTAAVKEFYVDKVVNTRLNALLGVDSDWPSGGNSTIERVEVKSDTVTYLDNFVAGCSKLKHLVLDCPKLDGYGFNPLYGVGLTNDVQDVIKPWITMKSNSDTRGFRFQYGGVGGMTGSLILTNVASWVAIDMVTSATNVWIRWGGTTYPSLNLKKVETVKIEMPNVTAMGSLTGVPNKMDVGEFIPKSIASIGPQSISDCSVTGTLVLTNLTSISGGNVLGICYNTGITGGDFKGPIESMWRRWTQNGSAWTNVALDCPRLTNLVSDVFYFNTTAGVPLELKIYGPVEREGGEAFWWTQGLVDTILNTVAAVTDYSKMKMTFYCSRKQGWADFAGCMKLSELAEEERAMAPEGCFGVYKTAAGDVKAWMVHMPQPDDPSGMCIRIQ